MEDTVSMLGVTSLVHSPSLYQGKIYQSLFPRTNHYQCQTVQPEAACPPSSGCWETLLCFHCKHKTTVIYDVKSLLATYHFLGCLDSALSGRLEDQQAFIMFYLKQDFIFRNHQYKICSSLKTVWWACGGKLTLEVVRGFESHSNPSSQHVAMHLHRVRFLKCVSNQCPYFFDSSPPNQLGGL